MAFRRIIFTGENIKDVKDDIERLFDSHKFQQDYADVKTTIKTGVKTDVLVVDLNGDGADSVSRKLKDIGNKFKVATKIRNEIKLAPVKENNKLKMSFNNGDLPGPFDIGKITIPDEKGIKLDFTTVDRKAQELYGRDYNECSTAEKYQVKQELRNNPIKESINEASKILTKQNILRMSEPELKNLDRVKGKLNNEPGYFVRFRINHGTGDREVLADFKHDKVTPSGMGKTTSSNPIHQSNVVIDLVKLEENKIKVSELKQLIKEELNNFIKESEEPKNIKIKVFQLKKGDKLGDGSIVKTTPSAGARTPSGKMEFTSTKNGKDYPKTWGKNTEITVTRGNLIKESEGLNIEGEIINVGDVIKWYNKPLNRRRQGTVDKIDETGIYIKAEGKTPPLKISTPYTGKEIMKIG